MLLLIIILVLLAMIYAYNSNVKYNTEYQILQLKPAQLNEAIIEERNPIIVETTQLLPDVLMSDVFRSKTKRVKRIRSNHRTKNCARVQAVSYNKGDKAMVEIITPKHAKIGTEEDDYQSMTIVLRKGHVLLLPFMWHFSSDRDLTTVEIHDWFSHIYSFVMA
jgi:hypothetical protein